MTCLDFLFADMDTAIHSEVDCIGCLRENCPNDKRTITSKKEAIIDVTQFSLDELMNAFKSFDLDYIQIVLAHPDDMLKIGTDQLPSNFYFITNPLFEQGKLYLVTDQKLKEMLYTYAINSPDKVLKGKRDI